MTEVKTAMSYVSLTKAEQENQYLKEKNEQFIQYLHIRAYMRYLCRNMIVKLKAQNKKHLSTLVITRY